jgi:hypothetical protein
VHEKIGGSCVRHFIAEPIKMENFDEKIEPYLLGELSEAELIAFEKLLKTDASLAKSVAKHREMMERLEALRLRKKVKKALAPPSINAAKVAPMWADRAVWMVAASLMLIAAALWFFTRQTDSAAPQMADHPAQPSDVLPTPDSTGTDQTAQKQLPTPDPGDSPDDGLAVNPSRRLALAREYLRRPNDTDIRNAATVENPAAEKTTLQLSAEAFDKGNFALSANLLRDDKTVEEDEMAQYLRASARFQIGQYAAAAADFDALKTSFQFKHDARWNYLLCQLALGDMKLVNRLLAGMLADKDYPFHEMAVALKTKLTF